MAHFLRGKQAGIQNDLSAGLAPEHFMLDDAARFGINSRISALAYEPIQSLLAVGTSESPYGSGQIYIFGHERVSAVFTLSHKASVTTLQFCGDKLLSLDSKHELGIYSLEKRAKISAYTPPSHVTAVLSDPSLDYVFLGLQSGDIVTFDLDRLKLAPFKLPNLWKERSPRARILPIVSLAFHPRDIGTLLIGYLEGAVTFSIKMNVPVKFFHYEVPPGAPGGDSDPSSFREVRSPRLTKAIWHPTGTFILTAHDDSSLVFWDPKDGRIVMARTLADVDVNKPGAAHSGSIGSPKGTFSLKEPIFQVAWCCKENPDNTGLLIAGGSPTTELTKGLTFFDLGPTPNYQTSSWHALSHHFAKPKSENKLPTPPNAEVVDFVLIPRSTPYFAGAQDPIAVIALLSSGELVTLSFPSGHPISPTNMLPLSLSFVHPFVNKIALAYVDRTRWLGWREKRAQGPPILIGGAPAKKPMKRFENRDIVQTAHADGIIRMWDTGHDDNIENPTVIQIDLARAAGRFEGVEVAAMSLAGGAGEFSAGLKSGEVVVFKWGRNRNVGLDLPLGENDGPGQLSDISKRADPGLKEGFIPLVLLNQRQGPVTALEHSDVGFICVGFQSGSLAIIDLRGPAVIYTAHLSDFIKHHRRGSIRKSHHASPDSPPEWPTCINFGVLSLEGEDYSSILCFVGTNRGNFATFKILPSSTGTYTVAFAGSSHLEDRVLAICPIDTETGHPALASQSAVANLRNGYKVNGVVVVVTTTGCRMFKPATHKGAHKNWDEFLCDAAGVVRTGDRYSLVGLFGDGRARAYSIPALKEISSVPIDKVMDMRRLGEAVISPAGDAIGWTGPSELAMLALWGAGLPLRRCEDAIYNPALPIPPRPTISNLQWISGTQYVSPQDMDLLIGGPDRPPSKKMLEQMRMDEADRAASARLGGPNRSNTPRSGQQSEEGYWAYMQRQMQERTENLNIMGDTMNRLEESSSGWANDVDKYVKSQKKKAVLGALGSKFGF
ncbi:hypothetical protein FQN55_004423 [Onygenales sp. PD_40]|nr:hypothetical protein FQN55_004423 [Onygenales sp. PD_40]KAK2773708.1 hypothetical protein FQN52_004515 [Onygenales sp. PD_12]KAK2786530.1 hypothetical protein FQN53_006464 [Emmonsiellopsis sp. PD_33]